MSVKKIDNKKSFTVAGITAVFILLYIVLFEFTIVTQNIFPKPSLLLESFISLWSEYKLLGGLAETTAVLFPAILFVILFIEVGIRIILTLFIEYSGVKNIVASFKYFSFFFFSLFFNLLWADSLLVEFIFVYFFVLSELLQVISSSLKLVRKEYIHSAKSLGFSKGEILSKVIWKDIKPSVYSNLVVMHTRTWIVVIIYEFVGSLNGVGSIYKLAYNYNDILAVISLGIFIALLVLLINYLIKLVVARLIFWK